MISAVEPFSELSTQLSGSCSVQVLFNGLIAFFNMLVQPVFFGVPRFNRNCILPLLRSALLNKNSVVAEGLTADVGGNWVFGFGLSELIA